MKVLYMIICITTLVSCAHYPDVRPSSTGEHEASFLTDYKDEGFKKAFDQAKDFCKDVHKKGAVQVSESSKYVGSMDEETYIKSKKASKLLTTLGGATTVLGGKKEKKMGALTMTGGGIASETIGQGYKYTLKFNCK